MIAARMRAVVLRGHGGPEQLDVRDDVPVPSVGDGEVLIEVAAAGVNQTDINTRVGWYEGGGWTGSFVFPRIQGIDACGRVVAVGVGVASSRVGERVVVEPCWTDRSGRTVFLGSEVDGAFAEYVVVPRANVWRNPASLAPEIASLQDPFGNAVHTVHAQDVAGRTVLITGGGGLIGSMAIPVARVAGAREVIATDVHPARLALAERMGADRVVDARGDAVAAVMDATDGAGADVVLEMSGHPTAIAQALESLRPGGDMAVLGLPSGPVTLDWAAGVVLKGATVRGIYGRRIWDTWYRMRQLLATGAVDLSPMITHRFGLSDFQAGFDAMRSGESGKVILTP